MMSYHFHCEFARTKSDYGITNNCILTELNSLTSRISGYLMLLRDVIFLNVLVSYSNPKC